jgi:hypothetical protein
MAKKSTRAAVAPTPCESGGPELLPIEIRVLQQEVLTFTVHVCRANASVRATLQAIPNGVPQSLFETNGQLVSSATFPALPPGRYSLFWSILTPATSWQTRADLSVNGTTRFLRRKSDTGNNPVNMGFLIIEVV